MNQKSIPIMETTQKKIEEIKSKTSDLILQLGLNEAHDYEGILDIDDILFYLNIIKDQLPLKSIGDRYMIKPREGKQPPGYKPTLKEKIFGLIEEDLIQADHGYDINAVKNLDNSIDDIKGVIADAYDDVQMRLAEHRATILATVFGFLNSVLNIEFTEQTRYVRIQTAEVFDLEILRELKGKLIESHPDLDLEKIMEEPTILPTDSSVITWRWVG